MPVDNNTSRRRFKPGRYLLLILLVLGGMQFVRRGSHSPGRAEVEKEYRELLERVETLNNEIAIEERILSRLYYVRRGEVRAGQGLFQALEDVGISVAQSLRLVNALTDSVEILTLSAGERFWITLDSLDTTRVRFFSYSPHPAIAHQLEDDGSGRYVYTRVERPTTERHTLYEGVLEQGSSLDQTLRDLGIHGSMVGIVNGVLLCRIPFRTHARAGDRFRVLIRERYFEDSIRIDGRVLYTSYEGIRAGKHEAFRYEDREPQSSYTAHYTEDGEALIYSGLRYPLDRLHISSAYGMRRHPLTGRRAMHWGVDYRAPTGTPVYAVAEGIVTISAYDGNNGHYVAIRHKDNYISYYLHLNQRLVRRGQHVATRQMIGRIGNTGISTGPHLHYGMKRPGGAWMDPLLKRMIATPKLEGERMAALKAQVARIREILDSLQEQRRATESVAFDN